MSKVKIVKQYIKDLSFEVPKAPEVFLKQVSKPHINVAINIDAKKFSEDKDQSSYEVTLKIKADAENKELFICEVEYAGIFIINNIAQEELEQILLIYCPNLLFPFVRKIIASNTIESGFSPLLLDPIDFADLYKKRKKTVN